MRTFSKQLFLTELVLLLKYISIIPPEFCMLPLWYLQSALFTRHATIYTLSSLPYQYLGQHSCCIFFVSYFVMNDVIFQNPTLNSLMLLIMVCSTWLTYTSFRRQPYMSLYVQRLFLLFFFFIIQLFHRFSFQCGNALYHVVDYVIFVTGDIVNPKLLSEYQLSRICISLSKKNALLVSNTNVLYTPFTRLLLCIRMFIPATIFISLWLIHGLLNILVVHG